MLTETELLAIKKQWEDNCPGCLGYTIADSSYNVLPCIKCVEHNAIMDKLLAELQSYKDTILKISEIVFDPEVDDIEHIIECHTESMPVYLRRFAEKLLKANKETQEFVWDFIGEKF